MVKMFRPTIIKITGFSLQYLLKAEISNQMNRAKMKRMNKLLYRSETLFFCENTPLAQALEVNPTV